MASSAPARSYDDGARRELAEEVGIRDAAPEPLFDFAYEDAANQVNGRVYRVVWDGPLDAASGGDRARRVAAALDGPSSACVAEPFCPDGVAALERYLAMAG